MKFGPIHLCHFVQVRLNKLECREKVFFFFFFYYNLFQNVKLSYILD